MGFQKFLLKNSRPGVDCELVLNQNHSKLLPDNQLQMEQYELSPLPENRRLYDPRFARKEGSFGSGRMWAPIAVKIEYRSIDF